MEAKSSLRRLVTENINYSLRMSSISGLSYVSYNGKRSKCERLFWTLSIISMIALATWEGLKVYNHYKERPVIVTVDKSYFDWNLTFPAMTLCLEDLKNQRELKQVIANLIQKFNLSENLLSSEYNDFVSYLKELAFKNYTNYEDYESYARGDKKEYLKPDQYMEVLDKVVVSLSLDKLNLSPFKFPFGVTRPIMRVFTEWGPCMVANPNISIYYTPNFFNASKPYQKYESIKYTVNDLASMMVKTLSKNNMYLYFHAPNEIMDLIDRKTILPSNTYKIIKYHTDLVTISEEAKFLSVQQKKCRFPYEPYEKPLKHSPVYSYKLCKFECKILIALKYCNCTPYYYRRLAHEPICSLTGLYCLSKYKAQLIYLSGTSDLCQSCPQNCNIGRTRELATLENNPFIQTVLEMYVKFPNEIYVRNLIFDELDLIVQIGGIFGLFLGCSLLSIVEIVYSFSLRLLCGIRNNIVSV